MPDQHPPLSTPAAGPGSPDALGGLMGYLDRSPTPWHAALNASLLLEEAGFERRDPGDDLGGVTSGFVRRGGSLVAWRGLPDEPFRAIGAHTDSPGFRLRPRATTTSADMTRLAVEPYGGLLLNSWLDRDLTLAGRIALRDPGSATGRSLRLFHHQGPILRIPQLAIHLDREVNEGLKLDRQHHVQPLWASGELGEEAFVEFLASELDVEPSSVLAWEAQLADTLPAARIGRACEFLASARLDDLCCCYGAIRALASAGGGGRPAVVVLNDHEEVGSTSATGALGLWLAQLLERLVLDNGGTRGDLLAALAGSELLSADMAHGTHPNYPERHEPTHPVALGSGPVIKHNVNQRYATEASTAAAFRDACSSASVPVQDYSHRGDLPCGSTIGPLTAAGLSIDTLDVGMAQLSMHSAREVMACDDVGFMCDAFAAWFTAA
ncbi:MAG: M18 family aminopeptidase [Microthrixaceae bacterium]